MDNNHFHVFVWGSHCKGLQPGTFLCASQRIVQLFQRLPRSVTSSLSLCQWKQCEMRNGGWIVWNSACWLAGTNEEGGGVCVSECMCECVCVCVCVWAALCCDSSVSGWSARLWRNGLPELPLRCPLTEHVAVCECVSAACVSVCVCMCIGGHTCTGNAMALNRVSQLCHDITRLWLQLKMMTGRVCVWEREREWEKEDKTVNVSVMCVCSVYLFLFCVN